MLKVARDLDVELTPETLAMLLYLADLDAIESGRTQFSGATWRWDDSGPYDHALMRAEEWVVESELVERREAPHADRDSYVLTVTVDIEDPLNAADMECVRSVVRLHGGRGVTGLEELSAGDRARDRGPGGGRSGGAARSQPGTAPSAGEDAS